MSQNKDKAQRVFRLVLLVLLCATVFAGIITNCSALTCIQKNKNKKTEAKLVVVGGGGGGGGGYVFAFQGGTLEHTFTVLLFCNTACTECVFVYSPAAGGWLA